MADLQRRARLVDGAADLLQAEDFEVEVEVARIVADRPEDALEVGRRRVVAAVVVVVVVLVVDVVVLVEVVVDVLVVVAVDVVLDVDA